MLDWNDLRIAVAVAEKGTITAAAKALALSQPTVSRRVSALEEALGFPVFLRSRGGYVASAAGARLLAPLADLAKKIDVLATEAADDSDAPRGTVRVAATEVSALHLLEGALAELRGRYPEIVVEMVTSNQIADLALGEVDLAVRFQKPEGAELVARKLGVMVYALYGAKSYLKRRGVPAHVRDLDEHDVVWPSRELARGPEARFLRERAPNARAAFQSNSMVALAAAAASGMGLAVLPLPLGDATRGLERILVLDEMPGRTTYLVSHGDARRSTRVRVVGDAIFAELSRRIARR